MKRIPNFSRYSVDEDGYIYGRKELAKRFGVSESHIKDIVSGRRGVWKESV